MQQCDKRSGRNGSEKKSQLVSKKKHGKRLQTRSGPDVQDTSWFDIDSVFGFGPND